MSEFVKVILNHIHRGANKAKMSSFICLINWFVLHVCYKISDCSDIAAILGSLKRFTQLEFWGCCLNIIIIIILEGWRFSVSQSPSDLFQLHRVASRWPPAPLAAAGGRGSDQGGDRGGEGQRREWRRSQGCSGWRGGGGGGGWRGAGRVGQKHHAPAFERWTLGGDLEAGVWPVD